MSIQNSINELRYAKEQFELFKDPPNYLEAFKHWNSFVDYLSKAFNKVEGIKHTGSNKFISAVNTAISTRRSDPLLRYLTEVRNANQHSIQELTGLEFTSDIPIGEFTLVGMETDESGNLVPVESTHNFYPTTYILKSIVNKGTPYHPPTIHRGRTLKLVKDPYEVGQLAIDFYENLFNDLSQLY